MARDKYKVPDKSHGDTAHLIVKAATSAIPVFGGPAAELFQAIVTPPLEKRRVQWMEEIAEGLRALEKNQGVKIEELKDNEQFISTLMQASHIAMRTHQKEKREALRNAVLNSSLPSAPEDAIQQIFLNYIDSFTDWHLQILKLFQNPERLEGVGGGALAMVILKNFPELNGKDILYNQVWRDLWAARLVNTETINGTMSAHGLAEKRTTDSGDRFLVFVAAPDQISD